LNVTEARDAGYYRVVSTWGSWVSVSGEFLVERKGIAAVGTATVAERAFDGTTGITVNTALHLSVGGYIAPDAVSLVAMLVTGQLSYSGVGEWGITLNLGGLALAGVGAGNYFVSSAVLVGRVTPFMVTELRLQGAVVKDYDGAVTAPGTAVWAVGGDGSLIDVLGPVLVFDSASPGLRSVYLVGGTVPGGNVGIPTPMLVSNPMNWPVRIEWHAPATHAVNFNVVPGGRVFDGTVRGVAGLVNSSDITISEDGVSWVSWTAYAGVAITNFHLEREVSPNVWQGVAEERSAGRYRLVLVFTQGDDDVHPLRFESSSWAVSRRTVNVTGVLAPRVFDGTVWAMVPAGALSLVGHVTGDDVRVALSSGVASFDSPNQGARTVSVDVSQVVLVGEDAGNYVVAGVSVTGSITPRPVEAVLNARVARVFDGSQSTANVTVNFSIIGVSGEALSLAPGYNVIFDSAAVGSNKSLIIWSGVLVQSAYGNYVLPSQLVIGNPFGHDIWITPVVTVPPSNWVELHGGPGDRVFDGTSMTAAQVAGLFNITVDGSAWSNAVTPVNFTFEMLVGGSWVNQGVAGVMRNAGTYRLVMAGVGGSLNPGVWHSAAWTVKPRGLTVVQGGVAIEREFDGTPFVTVGLGSLSVTGLGGDALGLAVIGGGNALQGQFTNINAGVGRGIVLDASQLTLTGAAAGNYEIVGLGSIVGTISQREVVITINSDVVREEILVGTDAQRRAITEPFGFTVHGIGGVTLGLMPGAVFEYSGFNVGPQQVRLLSGTLVDASGNYRLPLNFPVVPLALGNPGGFDVRIRGTVHVEAGNVVWGNRPAEAVFDGSVLTSLADIRSTVVVGMTLGGVPFVHTGVPAGVIGLQWRNPVTGNWQAAPDNGTRARGWYRIVLGVYDEDGAEFIILSPIVAPETSWFYVAPRAVSVTRQAGAPALSRAFNGGYGAPSGWDEQLVPVGGWSPGFGNVHISAAGASAAFSQSGVGNGIGINVTGLEILGGDRYNYVIADNITLTGSITAYVVSIVVVQDVIKHHDGTVAADVMPGMFEVRGVGGEVMTLAAGYAFEFLSPNITGGNVNATLRLMGTPVPQLANRPGQSVVLGNYVLPMLPYAVSVGAGVTVRILPPIGMTVSPEFTGAGPSGRVYDRTSMTAGAVIGMFGVELNGTPLAAWQIETGFTVPIRLQRSVDNGATWSEAESTLNWGMYRVIIMAFSVPGTDFELTADFPSDAFMVYRREISVSAAGITRAFNGLDGVELSIGSFTFGNILAADAALVEVAFASNFSARFADRNVGTGIGIVIHGGFVTGGAMGDNYVVAAPGDIGLEGTITAVAVDVVLRQNVVRMEDGSTAITEAVEFEVLGVTVGGVRERLDITGSVFRYTHEVMNPSLGIYLIGGTLADGTGEARNYAFANASGTQAAADTLAGRVSVNPGVFQIALFTNTNMVPIFTSQMDDRGYNGALGAETASQVFANLGVLFNNVHSIVSLEERGAVITYTLEMRRHGAPNWNPVTDTREAGYYRLVVNNFTTTDGSNYGMNRPTGERTSHQWEVAQRGVTVIPGAVAIVREFNGTESLTLQAGHLALSQTDIIPGDTVNLNWNAVGVVARFASAAAGVQAVIVEGLTLDNPNYRIFNDPVQVTGTITAITLNIAVTQPTTALTRVYDGTTAFTGNLSGLVSLTGNLMFGGAEVEFNARFDSRDAGNRTVILYGFRLVGEGAGNYAFPPSAPGFEYALEAGSGRITPAALTVTAGTVAATRQYTGDARLPELREGDHFIVEGVLGEDQVYVVIDGGQSVFNGVIVGDWDATMQLTGAVGGLHGGNYTVAAGPVALLRGRIEVREVSATVGGGMPLISRAFDNTTGWTGSNFTMELLQSNVTFNLEGLATDVSLVGFNAEFSSANVGNNLDFVITPQFNNSNVRASVTVRGEITRKAITVTAPSTVLFVGDDIDREGILERLGAPMTEPVNLPLALNLEITPSLLQFGTVNTANRGTVSVTVNPGIAGLNPNYQITFVAGAIYVNARSLSVESGGTRVEGMREGGFPEHWTMEINVSGRGGTGFAGGEWSRYGTGSQVFEVIFMYRGNPVTDVGRVEVAFTLTEEHRGFGRLGLAFMEGGEVRTSTPTASNNTVRFWVTNPTEFMVYDAEASGGWIQENWVLLAIIGGIAGGLILLLILVLLVMSSRRKRREVELKAQKQMMPMPMQPLMLGAGPQQTGLVPLATAQGMYGYPPPGYGRPPVRRPVRPAQAPQRKPPVQTRGGVRVGPNGRPIQEARVVQGPPRPGQQRPQQGPARPQQPPQPPKPVKGE
jgi:hypothetical protein